MGFEETVEELDGAVVDDAADTGDDQDSLESIATELGWNPDFEGEGKVDAKTYLLRSREIQNTMRDHIKEQKSQLSNLAGSVEELKIHNERVYKAEVTRLKAELSSLKKEKREAIEDGDVDKVEELEGQIGEVEAAIVQPEKTSSKNTEFDAWVVDNKWYNEDPEMAAYADTIAIENKGAPFARVAALVESKVKVMFPEKFQAATPRTPSPVEGSRGKAPTEKFSRANLTSDQINIMSQFVKQGIMTEKQYIADIAKLEGAA